MEETFEKKGKRRKHRKPIVFRGVTDAVLIRAADILDQNSFFNIYRHRGAYVYAVRVRRMWKEDIDFLAAHFGGYTAEQVMDQNQRWYWINYQAQRLFEFLTILKPFIGKKRRHMEIILEFKTLVQKNGRRKLSEEQKQQRQILFDELKLINQEDDFREDELNP